MIKKIAIVVLLIAVSSVFWLPPILRPIAEHKLRTFFVGAEVSVAKLGLAWPASAILSGIEIKSKQYEIKIEKAAINPDGRLAIFLPRVKLKKIPSEWFESKPGAKAPLKSVELQNMDLNLHIKSIGLETVLRGSVIYDFGTGQSTGRLTVDSLKWKTAQAKDVVIDAAGSRGTFAASELRVGKLRATALRGTVEAGARSIRIAPLGADLAGGRAEGELIANFENGLNYEATLNVQSLNMEKLTRDLELERKMSAGGTLDGKILLSGDRTGLRGFSGRLTSGIGGGDLVIRDPELIQRLAKNVRQPVEMVEAAFKEYHFDSGAVSLGLEDGDLTLSANLEGAKGKRDLVLRLHNQP